MRNLHITETFCKTILNRSKVGASDYTLNAYQGCAFGCAYCYVPVIRGFRGVADPAPWGGWVQVKVNAPDVLRRQMLSAPSDAKILIGTAADSWQPLEKQYQISRRLLEELALYPNPVSILTRSPLLLRDMDILLRMPSLTVGVSIPTFDDTARRIFEPYAPAIPGRVHLVRRLAEAGLKPRLFWCPILYGVSDTPEAVRDYFEHAAQSGVERIVCDRMNYARILAKPHMRLLAEYRRQRPGSRAASLSAEALSAEIARWSSHYGIECRL